MQTSIFSGCIWTVFKHENTSASMVHLLSNKTLVVRQNAAKTVVNSAFPSPMKNRATRNDRNICKPQEKSESENKKTRQTIT
jgi:hypothetical protein